MGKVSREHAVEHRATDSEISCDLITGAIRATVVAAFSEQRASTRDGPRRELAFAAALSSGGAGDLERSVGALPYELAFKLGDRAEHAEHQNGESRRPTRVVTAAAAIEHCRDLFVELP